MIAEIRARLGGELERLSAELAVETSISTEAEAARLRVATLGRLVAGLATVDPAALPADRAGFGSVVRARDLTTGEESLYTLMTGDLADPDEGHVSLASPIGHALLGRAPGDRVAVATPRGERRFELVSLLTLPQRVGLAPERAAEPAPSVRVA